MGNRQFDLMYFTQTGPDLDIFCSSKYTVTQTSLKTVLTIMVVSSYTSHGREKNATPLVLGVKIPSYDNRYRWVFYSGWVIQLLGSLVHHEIDSQAIIFVDAVEKDPDLLKTRT